MDSGERGSQTPTALTLVKEVRCSISGDVIVPHQLMKESLVSVKLMRLYLVTQTYPVMLLHQYRLQLL